MKLCVMIIDKDKKKQIYNRIKIRCSRLYKKYIREGLVLNPIKRHWGKKDKHGDRLTSLIKNWRGYWLYLNSRIIKNAVNNLLLKKDIVVNIVNKNTGKLINKYIYKLDPYNYEKTLNNAWQEINNTIIPSTSDSLKISIDGIDILRKYKIINE